jgi:hypothetical protein
MQFIRNGMIWDTEESEILAEGGKSYYEDGLSIDEQVQFFKTKKGRYFKILNMHMDDPCFLGSLFFKPESMVHVSVYDDAGDCAEAMGYYGLKFKGELEVA